MANYVGNKFGQADHEKLVNLQRFPCTGYTLRAGGLGLAFYRFSWVLNNQCVSWS